MRNFSENAIGRGAVLAFSALLAAAVFALAGFGDKSVGAQEDGERSLEESPPGQTLVVDANLLEGFVEADVADPTDMKNFAGRLMTQVPYAPDALLLQEVVGPSAGNVARFMSEETGFDYQVALAPGESHVVEPATEDTPEIRRETAIVLNTDTMRRLDEGGRIDIAYAKEDHGSGTWITKQEPYLMAKELRGGLRIPLVSLHYVPNNRFTSNDVGFRYKAGWSARIAGFLDETYPSPSNRQVEVMAGDFNNRPCVERDAAASDPDCTPMPFWEVLTERYGYSSAKDTGIDHIFARGEILDSGFDSERKAAVGTDAEFQECKALYNKGRSDEAIGTCATEFYSDHGFVWALVGMPTRADARDDRPAEHSREVRQDG